MASSSAAGASGGRGCPGSSRRRSPVVRSRRPGLRDVVAAMRRHAAPAEVLGEDKDRATSASTSPGTSRFSAPHEVRQGLAMVSSLDEVDHWLEMPTSTSPGPARWPRARAAGPSRGKRVALPDGWLDDPDDLDGFLAGISAAELSVSGARSRYADPFPGLVATSLLRRI